MLVEEQILITQGMLILLVSETRPMNHEKTLRIRGYQWIEKDRIGPSGRQAYGGVGILVADHLDLERQGSGEELVAANLKIGTEEWIISSIHGPYSALASYRRQLHGLSEFLNEKCRWRGIIIGGDHNAQTHLLTEYNNTRGKLVLEFVENHGLIILKSTDMCEGR